MHESSIKSFSNGSTFVRLSPQALIILLCKSMICEAIFLYGVQFWGTLSSITRKKLRGCPELRPLSTSHLIIVIYCDYLGSIARRLQCLQLYPVD